MADNTIDNLSIQVTASAENAARVFDRLASSAGRLRGAASGAAGGMQDMAKGARDARIEALEAGTQSGRARPNIKGVGKDAKDAGDNAKKGSSGIATFWQSLKRIAFYRFVRSVIRSITDAFKTGITNLYQWSAAVNGTFAKSMDRIATSTLYLKNSLGAMVSPLINALAPALDFIIDKVVDVLNWFNQLFAVLSGASTYTVAKKVASVWADAGKSAAGSAKKAADDIKRTILGFDEINKLVDNKNRGSGTGSGYSQPATAGSILFEEKPLTGGFKGFSDAIEKALNDTLSRIGLIISGASLAVGAILTFSGANVPLGLSMMAAGAAGLVSIIGMNWNGLSADIKLAIGAVEAVVGGSLLAIGGVLAFSGVNPALGIAMMAAGAISLAAAIGLNWDLITGKVSASAKGVVGAISAASLALGAILTFTGANVPLGVGLLVAGATGAVATISWDWLSENLRGKVATITSIVSGSLLAIGALLAFSNAALPLGIGMMAAGAVGLAATVTANWDVITETLRGPIGTATALISGAALVLGAVAIAAGRIPLGVGLLVAGSAGLASTIAARWDRLKSYLEGPIGTISALIGGASLMLGFVAISAGRIPLGVGLLVAGAIGLTATIAANWERLKGYMEGPLGTLITLLSGASLALGFVAIAAGRIPLGVGLLVAGASGLTATIAARWDRLKGCLEGPISTITALVGGALLMLGFVSIAAGRIPLGIGLLVAGASGLTATIAARWDRLKGYMQEPIGTITTLLSGASLMLGFVAIAAGRIPLGLGLIVAGATGIAASLTANWDILQQKLQGPIGTITGILSGATLLLGIIALVGGNIPLGIGLLLSGAAGLVGTISANWDNIVALGATAVAKVKEGWDNAKNFVIDIVVKIAGKIWDGITTFWDWIWGGGGNGNSLSPTKSTGYASVAGDVTVMADLDLKAGLGFDPTNIASDPTMWTLDKGIQTSLDNNPLSVKVGAQTPWGTSSVGSVLSNVANSVLSSLGLSNLSTDVDVGLKQNGWTSVSGWITDNHYNETTVNQKVGLEKNGWDWVDNWAKQYAQTPISQKVNLVLGNVDGKITGYFGGKRAKGGVFSGGKWSDIPQYAGGTAGVNHGSLFWAGENGAEIVGNAGGRTEVLNKSQIASAMYSAVQAAMAPAAANFAAAAENMGVAETGFDFETLADMVRQGVEQAMSRSNDYDRQKVELLRSINDKDFNVDVSTASINKAQSRMNRRAGVTIAPVGT